MKLGTLFSAASFLRASLAGASWSGWGASYLNNHWAESNRDITLKNIASLSLHCKIPDSAGQSAPPAIHGSFAYYPTWNGSFIALNYKTCRIRWTINVTQVTVDFRPITPLQVGAVNAALSRTSPQIDQTNNVLFFGTQIHALLVAADLNTGVVLATKQVNPHELAVITSSLTFYDDLIFVGVASGEESAGVASNGSYPCCSFIGNAAAFRFKRSLGRFTTVWNVTTIPTHLPQVGTFRWSGAGIWGGQPAVDEKRRQVFFATGNTYTVPEAWFHCTEADAKEHCFPSYIWQESVLALDIYTGRANWVRRLDRLDVWTRSCGGDFFTDPRNETLCPHQPGPDYDFGMAPSIVRRDKAGESEGDILVIGQKSGMLYGVASNTGEVKWSVLTIPGDTLGGLIWGVAADDAGVYYTGVNYGQKEWTLQPQNTTTVRNSIFGAASVKDGRFLWQIKAPRENIAWVMPTVIGDELVLFGASGPHGFIPSGNGTLIAVHKETGRIVWEYTLDGPFRGGFAVEGKYVFLGTGYRAGGGSFLVFKLGS